LKNSEGSTASNFSRRDFKLWRTLADLRLCRFDERLALRFRWGSFKFSRAPYSRVLLLAERFNASATSVLGSLEVVDDLSRSDSWSDLWIFGWIGRADMAREPTPNT